MKLVVYSSHREAVSCSHARITGNLQLSGLIGTASHQDMQKIRIIVFFFLKIRYIGRLNFCYYLHYIPACKHFDHV